MLTSNHIKKKKIPVLCSWVLTSFNTACYHRDYVLIYGDYILIAEICSPVSHWSVILCNTISVLRWYYTHWHSNSQSKESNFSSSFVLSMLRLIQLQNRLPVMIRFQQNSADQIHRLSIKYVDLTFWIQLYRSIQSNRSSQTNRPNTLISGQQVERTFIR